MLWLTALSREGLEHVAISRAISRPFWSPAKERRCNNPSLSFLRAQVPCVGSTPRPQRGTTPLDASHASHKGQDRA